MNKQSEKLRKAAESCMYQASKINLEISGAWTHRRQRFADSAASKKDTLQKRARMLNQLADEHDAGTVPECLKRITTAGDIDFVIFIGMPKPPDADMPKDGWYAKEYPAKKKKADRLGIESDEVSLTMKTLLFEYGHVAVTPDQQRALDLKKKITEARSFNIPGFFPTPDKLIDQMIDHAELNDGMSVLEPSAGMGDICDRILHHGFKHMKIMAVEQNHSLVDICRLKGHNTVAGDILSYTNFSDAKEQHSMIADRILMNPPFEKNQDVQHVMHCFKHFLKSGGVLVSIMASSITYNQKLQYFRDFVMENHGQIIINGQEFKEAFNSTGVATVTVVLHKSE